MTYCKAAEVRLLVNTNIEDDEIDDLIAMSDAEIDKRIGAQSASDVVVKKLSALITAYTIKIQQPQSEALGERSVNMGVTLELWQKEIERLYRLYKPAVVKASKYQRIDENLRYPGD